MAKKKKQVAIKIVAVDNDNSTRCVVIGSVRGRCVSLRVEGDGENWAHLDIKQSRRMAAFLCSAVRKLETSGPVLTIKSWDESWDEAVEGCDDLAIFQHVSPCGPLLPVWRTKADPEEPFDLGVLYRTDQEHEDGYAVLFTYVFDDDYLSKAKKLYYSTAEAVVAAGWMFDEM